MPNRVERATRAKSPSRLLAIAALTLLAALAQQRAARAQQPWTTPDAGGNISSTNSGNVGVGTSSPDAKMTVEGAIPAAQGKLMIVRTTGANNGYGLALDSTGTGNNNFGFTLNGVPKAGMAFDVTRGFFGINNFSYSGNDFALRLNSDGSLSFNDASAYPGPKRFRITAAGNVGIGTTTPSAKLEVNGSINVFNGNINTKFQDVAE